MIESMDHGIHRSVASSHPIHHPLPLMVGPRLAHHGIHGAPGARRPRAPVAAPLARRPPTVSARPARPAQRPRPAPPRPSSGAPAPLSSGRPRAPPRPVPREEILEFGLP